MKRRSIVVAAVIAVVFLCIFLRRDHRTKLEVEFGQFSGNGRSFVGSLDSNFDGQGSMTFDDGRKYVGHFKDGQMDGHGKMTYPDGHVEQGLWKDGKFIGAEKSP
jgi:hypothetical protein